MSESGCAPAVEVSASEREVKRIPIAKIFREFLMIGATSFGGGVVAYLRAGLVGERRWLDDEEFVDLLIVSETLPGLNATNMAVLVGDRLGGVAGAAVALTGICLPGAVLMFFAGFLYQHYGDGAVVAAALEGGAAAAVGLILATSWDLGRKSLSGLSDIFFVVVTVLAVNRFHQSVLRVLIGVGFVAILFYRPRKSAGKADGQ